MNDSLQTQLLGARVECKQRDIYFSDYDSDRGPLVGHVRTIAVVPNHGLVLQIEDDEGWIRTRSACTTMFRIARGKTFGQLPIDASFRWANPEQARAAGWVACNLKKVDHIPGWAMPEGWSCVIASHPEVQNWPVIAISDEMPPSRVSIPDVPDCEARGTCRCYDGCGACEGCGRWLGDEPERIEE